MHGLVRIKDQSAMNNRHGGLGKRKFPFLFQLFPHAYSYQQCPTL